MPELPEVYQTHEFIKSQLNESKTGVRKFKVSFNRVNLRYSLPKELLKESFFSQTHRVGKYIFLTGSSNNIYVHHLGMTGYWRYEENGVERKHDHVELIFKKGKLIYNDSRRFGFFKLLQSKKIESAVNFCNLGLDVYENSTTELFDSVRECFKSSSYKNVNGLNSISKLNKSNKNIKNFLMDQKYLAGLGNIYVCEILFRSRINPLELTKNITDLELLKIIKSSKYIIKKAVERGGTTIKSFYVNNQKGSNQNFLKVYGKSSCYRCKNDIKNVKIASRSTYFCMICQPKKYN